MEKEPTLIEQKFEDAVKNFRKEMEKRKLCSRKKQISNP